MGMAASQARLLSLTSRLHDIELKAQNIQSQKIALATQKDELYQDYCDALDATSIKAQVVTVSFEPIIPESDVSGAWNVVLFYPDFNDKIYADTLNFIESWHI